MKRLITWGALLVALTTANAAEIKVATEYRYPTEYQVTPVTRTDANGNTTIAGGIVTPTRFETREVGVAMSVQAIAFDMVVAMQGLRDAEQRGLYGNTDLMIAAASGDCGGGSR